MSIYLKDIQSLSILNKAKVHSGNHLLAIKKVEWISVIEAPVESFVRQNEYVLTTGVSFSENVQSFQQFVEDIITSNAAALAIAFGPYVKEIPQSIIELAENHQLPLIELAWTTRFADIIKEVINLMQRHKHEYVERIELIRRALLDYILNGQSLSVVAQHVSDSIQSDVIIADKKGMIRGYNKKLNPMLEKAWQQSLNKSLLEDGLEQETENQFQWILYDRKYYALQLSIQLTGHVQGYVVIGDFSEEPLTPTEEKKWKMLLEHVTTAIAIYFLHEQAAKEAEWRLRDDFVWELSQGSIHSTDLLRSRAKSLNYQIHLPYICLILHVSNLKESYDLHPHLPISFDHWHHECIRHIEEEAERTAKSMAIKLLVTYQHKEFVLFIETSEHNVISHANTFINRLKKRIQMLYPYVLLTWGIANQFGYSCFNESYLEAKRAIDIGRKRRGEGTTSVYADTKVDRVLELLLLNKDLQEIAYSVLSSLLRYEQNRQIDLIHTFTTYHANHGNVSQTARQLNLHRQSLLYRLRKIETLTNCQLSNADDLFLLDLSIRLWLYGMEI
ncbi:PucR family transcriptional regulator [Halalkalibacter sp. APA_J-10(15)]|uniref:PucR family transcriptional regulator n=1 Tax=Halalkalibacter sp. APA_J-10(15) TaxID=2933805 RepID=UPI001FF4FBE9|nr:PucR family transcriptional regulator [Halalkalibacter sp. APA_J-10(15)]MCK0472048.1 PucR family transcriptional regulator ligand-binding domain-containing protein [Halalkalibacter sp. APA_J-10(15)]